MMLAASCAARSPSAARAFATAAPLVVPLPGTPKLAPPTAAVPELASASISKLDNGVTVISLDNKQPGASLAVAVRAGSAHETAATSGVSHFLRAMAWCSTQNRSALRLVRGLDSVGATFDVVGQRMGSAFRAACSRDELPTVLPLLADVTAPRLQQWEMRDSRPLVAAQTKAAAKCKQTQLVEALHAEAFRGSGLALPFACPKWNLHKLTEQQLAAHVAALYTGARTVLVGYNVAHEQLVSLAAKSALAKLPAAAAAAVPAEPAAPFVGGGEVRIAAGGDLHLGVAFGAPSQASGKDFVAALVVQALLNGRSGVLNRALVEKHEDFVKQASAFVNAYPGTSLFGVYVRAAAGHAPQTAAAVKAVLEAAAAGNVSDADFARARNIVGVQLAFDAEQRCSARKALAESVAFGASLKQRELLAGLTAADVKRVASAILGSSRVVAAVGDVNALPRF